jgi:hypothetical protein
MRSVRTRGCTPERLDRLAAHGAEQGVRKPLPASPHRGSAYLRDYLREHAVIEHLAEQ